MIFCEKQIFRDKCFGVIPSPNRVGTTRPLGISWLALNGRVVVSGRSVTE